MKAAVPQGLKLIMETGSSAISWKRGCREPAPNPLVCYAPDKGAVKGRCAMGELGGE